jgi:hypothetical protein
MVPTPSIQGQRPIPTCFLCNKKGHIKANCWFNPQNKGKIPQTEAKKEGEVKELLLAALAGLNMKQNDKGIW